MNNLYAVEYAVYHPTYKGGTVLFIVAADKAYDVNRIVERSDVWKNYRHMLVRRQAGVRFLDGITSQSAQVLHVYNFARR
jgi:hypothetical protein